MTLTQRETPCCSGNELAIPLEEIARILDDPSVDVRAALREQRRALLNGIERSRGGVGERRTHGSA